MTWGGGVGWRRGWEREGPGGGGETCADPLIECVSCGGVPVNVLTLGVPAPCPGSGDEPLREKKKHLHDISSRYKLGMNDERRHRPRHRLPIVTTVPTREPNEN